MNLKDLDYLRRMCGLAVVGSNGGRKISLKTQKAQMAIWTFWQGVRAANNGTLPQIVEIYLLADRLSELVILRDGE